MDKENIHRGFDLPPLEELKEREDERGLRPLRLSDFNGQTEIKSKLEVYIQAAKKREEALDHLLFYGPPGLGKTTLAGIIAHEMNSELRVTTGPALEKPGDLAAILSNLQDHDVLFIDEIHRMSTTIEEVLYSAMEDFTLHIIVGKGPLARSICLNLPHFTLVGATTRLGLLSAPLRARFGIVEQLRLYTPEELCVILDRGAGCCAASAILPRWPACRPLKPLWRNGRWIRSGLTGSAWTTATAKYSTPSSAFSTAAPWGFRPLPPR